MLPGNSLFFLSNTNLNSYIWKLLFHCTKYYYFIFWYHVQYMSLFLFINTFILSAVCDYPVCLTENSQERNYELRKKIWCKGVYQTFWVLTVDLPKIQIVWDITLCRMIQNYLVFENLQCSLTYTIYSTNSGAAVLFGLLGPEFREITGLWIISSKVPVDIWHDPRDRNCYTFIPSINFVIMNQTLHRCQQLLI